MAKHDHSSQITALTPLETLPGLSAAPRNKLQRMGVTTLGEIAQNLSKAQLKSARNIGPKTLQLLEQALQQAGLEWADNRLNVSYEISQQIDLHQQNTEQLKQAVAAWVCEHEPETDQAWRQHQPGAYGEYLKAQLKGLNYMKADRVILRDFEHQLVRSLNRYQKQQRYAKSREAMMDGIAANARRKRSRR
ncbi:MAG: hypothetical protein OQK12_12615 [Motiliproteus sp.]|nr:hypothetical protein [Motiliproteus sp.]MCW9052760.1 hypothetical protein [Motiliproteus sp.]